MRKLILPAAAVVGTVVTLLKRRKAAADAELWREATSDTSR